MKSGMVVDQSLNGDLWPFLASYLQQNLIGTPGVTGAYSNTNFTILQALIDKIAGPNYQGYVDYVNRNVLIPMKIDTRIFNATPDPESDATLYYSSQGDESPGLYWEPFDFVAPGGWVASPKELIKFLVGVRNNVVLSEETTECMFNDELGLVST